MINAKQELILKHLLPVEIDTLEERIKELTNSEELAKEIVNIFSNNNEIVNLDTIIEKSIYFPKQLVDELDSLLLEYIYQELAVEKDNEETLFTDENFIRYEDFVIKLLELKNFLEKKEYDRVVQFLYVIVMVSLIKKLFNKQIPKKFLPIGNILNRLKKLISKF